MIDCEELSNGCSEFGLRIGEREIARFRRYAELLSSWNKRTNLTSIDESAYVSLHFLDSLSVAQALNVQQSLTVIDVGSGAGFPGIPLKIVLPQIELTLAEANTKKARFLELLCHELELPVELRCERAEVLARCSDSRERWEVAVARALAPPALAAELLAPLVRVGGRIILMGSAAAVAPPTNELGELGVLQSPAIEVQLCNRRTGSIDVGITRQLIVLDKISSTPLRFPRSISRMKRGRATAEGS